MRRIGGFALALAPLIGCAPHYPQNAEGPPISVQGSPIARGHLADEERSGGPPQMPWPAFKADLATLATKAEMAIIWRGHELRERHPGATSAELAHMLARDDIWKHNAQLVPPPRRMFVIREALMLW